MSTDTKWTIGTVVGTGLAIVTAVLTVGGLLLAQFGSVNARIDALDASLNARIADVRAARMAALTRCPRIPVSPCAR